MVAVIVKIFTLSLHAARWLTVDKAAAAAGGILTYSLRKDAGFSDKEMVAHLSSGNSKQNPRMSPPHIQNSYTIRKEKRQ